MRAVWHSSERKVDHYAAEVSAPSASRFTAEGTNQGDFATGDWGLLLVISCIWGSSFLWIAVGLDSFHPGTIAFLRMVLGSAVIFTLPAARVPVARSAWGPLAVVAIAGNAAPAVLFPLGQQRIESSVAGMLNSISPIMVLLIAVLMTRKAPQSRQVFGLMVGLIGAVLLALPNISGVDAQPLGVFFVVLAVTGYATSNNFLPRLAQDYNGAAVMARAMGAAAIVLIPYGSWGIGQSDFSWKSFGAVVILGVVGTGIARSMFATLNGRIGAPRSSLVGYLVPVVAVTLGMLVRDESVGPMEIGGTVLVLVGATLISRGRR